MEDKLHSLPSGVARHALREPAVAAYAARRRVLQLLGLAALAGGAAYTARETDAWQFAAADYSTHTGEIREVALPDGTRIVLNTATAIDLQFNGEERRVVLRAGEILVTTAPDPAAVHRPFRVQSRHGTVQALGTRFTTRQDGDVSRVAVFEGAVEIRPTHGTAVRLNAGQGTAFSADQVAPPVAVQESAAAWSRGLLVAENMRVADFLAELGRYRPGLLRCAPAIAELRVSGVFSLRDTDRALLNLTLGLPVEVVYRTRYWVAVRAR
jgi:transmembrane sensor